MKINKNSLQTRIKNLSSQKGVPSNVILQDYFFDAFNKTFLITTFMSKRKKFPESTKMFEPLQFKSWRIVYDK